MPRRGENIRKRKDGRWEGRYRTASTDGKNRYVSIYGKSYREVKEKLMDRIRMSCKTASEDIYQPTASTINQDFDFCGIFEEWLETVAQTRKYSTYVKYRTLYRCHIQNEFYGDKCGQMTNSHVSDRLAEQEISDGTRRSLLAVIRQALRYAEREYRISTPSLINHSAHSIPHPIEIMDRAEQTRLIRFLLNDSDISKIGIYLCLSTGLRLGEVCSLKWNDIDQTRKLIHVNRTVQRISSQTGQARTTLLETAPKTVFSRRDIPISDELFSLLMAYRQDSQEYVLCGHKPMEPRTYQNHFKNYLQQINAPAYNFHTLRHTFATNCIGNGMDIKSLSEILGHSNVQFTMNRYVHPTMDTKRQYINALATTYGQLCGQLPTSV